MRTCVHVLCGVVLHRLGIRVLCRLIFKAAIFKSMSSVLFLCLHYSFLHKTKSHFLPLVSKLKDQNECLRKLMRVIFRILISLGVVVPRSLGKLNYKSRLIDSESLNTLELLFLQCTD